MLPYDPSPWLMAQTGLTPSRPKRMLCGNPTIEGGDPR
jgi:hypothetical protein